VIKQAWLYPVSQLNLLIPDLPNLQVTPTGLKANGTQTLQGATYRYWTGSNLAAATLQVSLQGLIPTGGADPRAVAAASGVNGVATVPLATTPLMQKEVPIAMGSILLVALCVALVLPLRKQKVVDRATALQQEKTTLIQRIAQWDDQQASGKIEVPAWSHERARLKSTLLEVAHDLAAATKK